MSVNKQKYSLYGFLLMTIVSLIAFSHSNVNAEQIVFEKVITVLDANQKSSEKFQNFMITGEEETDIQEALTPVNISGSTEFFQTNPEQSDIKEELTEVQVINTEDIPMSDTQVKILSDIVEEKEIEESFNLLSQAEKVENEEPQIALDIDISEEQPTGSPNLTTYQPRGWSSKIVISTSTGSHSDSSSIYSDQNIYLDFAVLNNGSATVNTKFYGYLYVDNVLRVNGSSNPPLYVNWYAYWDDVNIGKLSGGSHTFKLVLDPTNAVNESNESDNQYSRSKSFTSRGNPNLTPFRPDEWSDKIVVSNVSGTFSNSSTIYSDENVYIDWAVINNGSVTINNKFYTKLYVDNTLKYSWYSTSLQPNWYTYVKDYNIGHLSASSHTIKIITDATNTVTESKENDNEYSVYKSIKSRGKPNLSPYKPGGWSNPIVISNRTGTYSDCTTIYSNENIYVDWAVVNNGAIQTSTKFYTKFYINNSLKNTWNTPSPLHSNYYTSVHDYNIGKLSAGTYTFKIITDSSSVISESNESDNQFSRSKSISTYQIPKCAPENVLLKCVDPNNCDATPDGDHKKVGEKWTKKWGPIKNWKDCNIIDFKVKVKSCTRNGTSYSSLLNQLGPVFDIPANSQSNDGVSFIHTFTEPGDYRLEFRFVSDTGVEISQGGLSPLYATVVIEENDKPNLTPYKPSTWRNKIIVSNTDNTFEDSPDIYSDQNIYIDWAVVNNGQVQTTKRFTTNLFVDNVEKGRWYSDPPLNKGSYAFVKDKNIGKLSSGWHSFTVKTDYLGDISESNESDNTFSRNVFIDERKFPNLTPYKPTGWGDKIVVSNVTGAFVDSDTIYSDQNIYIDWAVINNGEASTDKRFNTKLFIDNVSKGSWNTDPNLNKGSYAYIKDANIGKLAPGIHNFKLVTDTEDVIVESNENESDNAYTKPDGKDIVERQYPNLIPYKPKDWDNVIVASNKTGTHTEDSKLCSNQNIYVDWAVINSGLVETDKVVHTALYVDDTEKGVWYSNPPIKPNYYVYKEDVNLGQLSSGCHTLKIVTDIKSVIQESSESDNTVTRSKCPSACLKPSADFSGSPRDSNQIPLSVEFKDQSSNNPTAWLWDFGDGEQSSEQNPEHIYRSYGKFSVSMTASNDFGNDFNTKSNYVIIEEPEFQLFISKTGTGTGTITSDISGIDCGSDCFNSYKEGTVITLSATADKNAVFSGWSGDGCSGSSNCTLNMLSDITISATFDGVPDIRVDPTTLFFDNFQDSELNTVATRTRSVKMIQPDRLKRNASQDQTLECNIDDLQPTIIQKDDFDIVTLSDEYDLHADNSGEPLLPAKLVYVLVPPDSTFESLDFTIIQKKTLEGTYNIYPKQPETPLSEKNDIAFVPLNDDLSNSDKPFPGSPVEFIESAIVHGNHMLVFRIWPIQYIPKQGKILVNEIFQWTFNLNQGVSSTLQYNNRSSMVEEMLKNTVVNPDQVENMSKRSLRTKRTFAPNCNYLIITNSLLSEHFNKLAEYKKSLGLSVDIVTVEDIYEDYEGVDNQQKIKNCILDYATNRGTIWGLLGGDDTIVPDRNCYGNVNSGMTTDNTIPTDLFYAGLDDLNWNDDGDDKWCETLDEGDSIDMFPDIFIGRAPVRTTSDVDAFVDKTIHYTTKNQIDFNNKALLSGVELWNTWDGKSDAHHRTDDMWQNDMKPFWDGNAFRLYDTETDFGSSDYDVTAMHLQEQINSGYNILFMATHGNQSIWGMESGEYFSSNHALGCNNKYKQGIIYTIACITNAFDSEGRYQSDPSLSEGFIRNSNGGAVGYIGSSRYGWGYSSKNVVTGPSFNYARQFFRQLFDDTKLSSGNGNDPDPSEYPRRLGAVHASHKMYYSGFSSSYGAYRWVQFALNLMGDPHLEIKLKENQNSFTIQNEGNAELRITSLSKRDNSSWISFSPHASSESPIIIPQGDSISISVSIDWANADFGMNEDQIVISSNVQSKNPYPEAVYIKAEKECPKPEVDFNVSSEFASVSCLLTFNNESKGGDEWLWDFGDGETSALKNPSHTYKKPGVYSITLEAFNECGASKKTKQNYITISYPEASFITEKQVVSEDVGNVTVTVTLDKASGVDVTIPLIFNGTAVGYGEDFDVSDSKIEITSGNLSNHLTFSVVNDSLDETVENLIIIMDDLLNANTGQLTTHTVIINDNDSSPVIEDQEFSIDENSPAGTFIGKIVATDEDASDVLSYSITNENPAFDIDAQTGTIQTVNQALLDFETFENFQLNVLVSDGTNLDSASVQININDVNEPPVCFDGSIVTKSNEPVFFTLVAQDEDRNDTLTFSIVKQGLKGLSSIINDKTGLCRFTPSSNAVGEDVFVFQVSDGILESKTANVLITIDPSNELFKITGDVLYNGTEEGQLLIDAYAISDLNKYTPIGIGYSGDWYGYTSVSYDIFVPDGTFKIEAFIDSNASSVLEKTEPYGKYQKPVTINGTDDILKRDISLCLKGDIDGDLEITPQDAVDIFWLSFKEPWTSEQLCNGDYDEDFEITPQDAVDIFKASF